LDAGAGKIHARHAKSRQALVAGSVPWEISYASNNSKRRIVTDAIVMKLEQVHVCKFEGLCLLPFPPLVAKLKISGSIAEAYIPCTSERTLKVVGATLVE